jgi:hypothetical protein
MSIFSFKKSKDKLTGECTTNAQTPSIAVNSDSDPLLDLLLLIDKANHYVKEGEWNSFDKDSIYALKDRFLSQIYTRQPKGTEIELFYVPYYKYSRETKDKAGEMMRRDGNKHNFDYYLALIEPSANDYEVPGAGTIEMLITYRNKTWSFHLLEDLARRLNIDITKLSRKEWVNQRDFHSIQAKSLKAEAESLLSQIWT